MPTYAINKRARYDYEILETFEAGIQLSGPEVKSARGGHINLKGSYVTFRSIEAFLTNAHISHYRYASSSQAHDPTRPRKILLHQKQIQYLRGKSEEKGLTIVPLSIYTKGRHIKVEVGVAKGKKKYDKREAVKRREVERDMKRIMKEK